MYSLQRLKRWNEEILNQYQAENQQHHRFGDDESWSVEIIEILRRQQHSNNLAIINRDSNREILIVF